MIKNWRRKLAERLAPERAVEETVLRRNYSDAIQDRHLALRMAEDAQERLATAATSIANHMKDAAVLRNALRVTKPYVQDAADALCEELLRLSPKSKKRPAVIATLEAIQSDLRKIEAALAPAKENGKPVGVNNVVSA
jgi:ubiquinone/menaquinone biosynthesis C-methylase UbiE